MSLNVEQIVTDATAGAVASRNVAVAVGAGEAVVVFVSARAATCAVTDDGGNTYVVQDTPLQTVNGFAFVCLDAAAATTLTITPAASSQIATTVYRISGQDTSAVDAAAYDEGGSATQPPTVALTTVAADTIVLGGIAKVGAGTSVVTAGDGFTDDGTVGTSGGSNVSIATAHQILTAQATVTLHWTLDIGRAWSCPIVSLAAGAAAPSPQTIFPGSVADASSAGGASALATGSAPVAPGSVADASSAGGASVTAGGVDQTIIPAHVPDASSAGGATAAGTGAALVAPVKVPKVGDLVKVNGVTLTASGQGSVTPALAGTPGTAHGATVGVVGVLTAPTILQRKTGATLEETLTVVLDAPTALRNAIVVAVSLRQGVPNTQTIRSVTDDAGNRYRPYIGSKPQNGGNRVEWWVAQRPSRATSITIEADSPVTGILAEVFELDGAPDYSVAVATSADFAGNTSTGPVMPPVDALPQSLVLGNACYGTTIDANLDPTADGGFTKLSHNTLSGVGGQVTASKESAGGTEQAAWLYSSGTRNYAASLLVIRPIDPAYSTPIYLGGADSSGTMLGLRAITQDDYPSVGQSRDAVTWINHLEDDGFLGRRLAFRNCYSNMDTDSPINRWPTNQEVTAWERDEIAYVQIHCRRHNASGAQTWDNSIGDSFWDATAPGIDPIDFPDPQGVVQGDFDVLIDGIGENFAQQAGLYANGAPFWLCFHHEPGDDCVAQGYSQKADGAAAFVRAFNHWKARWDLLDIPNLLGYIVNLTDDFYKGWVVDDPDLNADHWFTGLTFEPIVGVDSYVKDTKPFQTFQQQLQEAHDFAAQRGAPLHIGELGFASQSGDGSVEQSKATWIEEMAAQVKAWGNVLAVCWQGNTMPTQPYLDYDYYSANQAAATAAFSAHMLDPYFARTDPNPGGGATQGGGEVYGVTVTGGGQTIFPGLAGLGGVAHGATVHGVGGDITIFPGSVPDSSSAGGADLHPDGIGILAAGLVDGGAVVHGVTVTTGAATITPGTAAAAGAARGAAVTATGAATITPANVPDASSAGGARVGTVLRIRLAHVPDLSVVHGLSVRAEPGPTDEYLVHIYG